MVRFQPQYPPVQKRMPVLAQGSRATGAARKKAIVAVARRLAVDLWRIHTGQCTAEQLGLQSEPSRTISLQNGCHPPGGTPVLRAMNPLERGPRLEPNLSRHPRSSL